MSDRKEQKKRPEPIVDGDARPDQYPNKPLDLSKQKEKKQKDFTTNRQADSNSLEDFKDRKES